MDFLWSENAATPRASHFSVAIYFAFASFAARFFLDRFVFRRLAIRILTKGRAPLHITKEMQVKIGKCSESMWKLTYYATVEAFILKITYQEPWFSNTKLYFNDWPNHELKSPLVLYYMCQCGFYIYSIAAILTWETRRKDFAVMFTHHVITVLLIGISYLTSFFRVGSIILALHDASDVFMEAAKVFKYSGREFGASVCFGFFAVSWLILRLIFFPFWVIKATSIDLQQVLNLSEGFHMFLYYVFNTMLIMLLIFHIYWWKLICAMILRQLKNRGKVGEDIRSGTKKGFVEFSFFLLVGGSSDNTVFDLSIDF
uniref:TLC domain-containing protein n=1 Tax=Glycine max TaxID=3847 RepID=A0A0R0L423_SOYBN